MLQPKVSDVGYQET